jgi:hypothetical protein
MSTKTVQEFQTVYGKIEEWYAELKGERKSWVDDNWKSMMEHFLEYAEQSLQESVQQTEGVTYIGSIVDCPAAREMERIGLQAEPTPTQEGFFRYKLGSITYWAKNASDAEVVICHQYVSETERGELVGYHFVNADRWVGSEIATRFAKLYA